MKSIQCPSLRSSTALWNTRRYYSTRPSKTEPHHIAVIGGGITGLATTFYAAKRFPRAKITLFEASNRLGGVIDSITVQLKDGTSAVCEMGPRTLRANAPRAIVTIDLVHQLGLDKELIIVPKSDPIASTRYIWYPDHLVTIPVANLSKSVAHIPAPDRLNVFRIWSLLRTLWTELLFKGLLPGLIHGLFIKRPDHASNDDSIYNVLQRRFGKRVTENLCSAIIHGLYAGDMRKLSARSLCPGLWTVDSRSSILNYFISWLGKRKTVVPVEKWSEGETVMLQRLRTGQVAGLEKRFQQGTVFSFKGGIGCLTDRLAEEVKSMTNVSIRMNARIESLRDYGRDVCLRTKRDHDSTHIFNYVISTTSLPISLDLIIPGHTLQSISHVPIMTTTLCYSTPNLNHPHHGFGYLLPFTLPPEQNPECALGVIFDSDAIPNLGTFRGTTITVMLGGRYWSSLPKLPTTDQGIEMAQSLLRRQLGIMENPIAVVARLEMDAIPQYAVGHFDMLREVHGMLNEYGGKVRVAGNSYHGIGVHDCLYSAKRVVEGLDEEGRTALEWCE